MAPLGGIAPGGLHPQMLIFVRKMLTYLWTNAFPRPLVKVNCCHKHLSTRVSFLLERGGTHFAPHHPNPLCIPSYIP